MVGWTSRISIKWSLHQWWFILWNYSSSNCWRNWTRYKTHGSIMWKSDFFLTHSQGICDRPILIWWLKGYRFNVYYCVIQKILNFNLDYPILIERLPMCDCVHLLTTTYSSPIMYGNVGTIKQLWYQLPYRLFKGNLLICCMCNYSQIN